MTRERMSPKMAITPPRTAAAWSSSEREKPPGGSGVSRRRATAMPRSATSPTSTVAVRLRRRPRMPRLPVPPAVAGSPSTARRPAPTAKRTAAIRPVAARVEGSAAMPDRPPVPLPLACAGLWAAG